ncbi:MAG TPA: cell wall-binding repeat-containing protein, partial [Egibacteraceae bacterium]|nr:cell wall-binding repeat-containing protein [Egibacteraceae bacterium]
GRNYPDALAAGPAVGDSGGVLLLLDGQGLDGSPPARAWLTEHRSAFTLIRLVGGPAAISAAVEDEIRATVGA